MQGSRKRAFEKILPRAEAPDGRLVIDGEAVPLGEATSVKVGLKPYGDGWRLTVKLKDPAPQGEAAPVAGSARTSAVRPRYKDLKKRMERAFTILESAAAAGSALPADALAAFVADSRLMTTYSGKGDPDYPAYNAAVDALEAAASAGDPAAVATAVSTLRRLKKECHSHYA